MAKNVVPLCYSEYIRTKRKDNKMSLDYLDFETVTNTKCVECGDKLAEWEDNLCIICETLAE